MVWYNFLIWEKYFVRDLEAANFKIFTIIEGWAKQITGQNI